MNTIITVSTIMSMYMNLVTDVTNTNYCYNAEIDNGRVMAMTVYNNHGVSLEAKVRHEYLYDSEDRLVRKETLKWNSLTASWEKYSCLDYSYVDGSYTVEKMMWDNTRNEYADAGEYSHYTVLLDNVLAVNSFKMDSRTGEYVEAERILVMNIHGDNLIATTM